MKEQLTFIVIFISMCFISFFAIKGCINAKQENESLVSVMQDSAKIWRDKYGTAHAQVEALEVQASEVITSYTDDVDSMSALLKVKPKQIKSITYVPFQAHINLDSFKTIMHDTLTNTVTDTIPGQVNFNAVMSLTKYQKSYGFLDLKKKDYLDVHFNNPIFTPLNISGFEITPKQVHWSVGPFVGYGWNGNKWAPSIGISINYSLIKF